jgi:hypothetical protein
VATRGNFHLMNLLRSLNGSMRAHWKNKRYIIVGIRL